MAFAWMGVFLRYETHAMMNRYKMILSYDGSDFHGWQKQSDGSAVADYLEKTFVRVFGHPVHIIGASRTDAGVHALGQVALLKTNFSIQPEKLHSALNKSLPSTLHIRSLSRCDETFHPCFGVLQKTYWYFLFKRRPLPFLARYGWYYHCIDRIDLTKFNSALQLYCGTHDFASFCKREIERSTIRQIDAITLRPLNRWGALGIEIRGKSFLHFQIRRMIGYALDVACRKDISVEYIKTLLDNPAPEQKLLKAGASGLLLRRIVYHEDVHASGRIS